MNISELNETPLAHGTRIVLEHPEDAPAVTWAEGDAKSKTPASHVLHPAIAAAAKKAGLQVKCTAITQSGAVLQFYK
jgi:hypothetical protein